MKMPMLRKKRPSRRRPVAVAAAAVGVAGAMAALIAGLRRKRRAGGKHDGTPAPALTPVSTDAR
ncbi:hypothetical protein [Paractinoplanes maris]|uniref:hypothetical protein n=1 Tax=Paractinoplanes maris TaxID=1734446 RepID=UPI002021C97F|nr:hypothetical protein [Actinoplanes maris]